MILQIEAGQVLPIALCTSKNRSPIPLTALKSRAFAGCLGRQLWRGRAAGCRETFQSRPLPEKSLSCCAVENTSGPPDSERSVRKFLISCVKQFALRTQADLFSCRPSSQALDKEIASLALPVRPVPNNIQNG